jgi:hypothetical protein
MADSGGHTRSFLSRGRERLLLGELDDSLTSYVKGIQLALSGEGPDRIEAIEAELVFLSAERHETARRLLALARIALGGARHGVLTAKRRRFAAPAVILAGGASPSAEAVVDVFRDSLLRAFEGFGGTVISGGTRCGIAGLAGELSRVAPDAGIVGYIPRSLPAGDPLDGRYSEHIATDGDTYGAREPLQYWTDLLLAGVAPGDVCLIAIGGGPIAAFEYRLALALGAKVAILQPANNAAAALQEDPEWRELRSLLPSPNDAMTIRALADPPRPALSAEQVESAARLLHSRFLDSSRYRAGDTAMAAWPELREDLKSSNRTQAAWIAGLVERIGYVVEPAADASPAPLTAEEVERLAEMEHGRWTAERLGSGWRYGAARDAERKLSPYLAPWTALTEEVKGYDRQAVLLWPGILAAAGLRVRKR